VVVVGGLVADIRGHGADHRVRRILAHDEWRRLVGSTEVARHRLANDRGERRAAARSLVAQLAIGLRRQP
jgi:hypothetical protein